MVVLLFWRFVGTLLGLLLVGLGNTSSYSVLVNPRAGRKLGTLEYEVYLDQRHRLALE